jgi:hypothetical protein
MGVQVLFALLLGHPSHDLTDARQVLLKADAAVKGVQVAHYQAKARGVGVDEARMPASEGTALLSGWQSLAPLRYRYSVKLKRAGSEEVTEYIAGSDGDVTYLIDPAKKMVYADMDPAVLGSAARQVRGISLGKLVNPDGFADELKAEKLELKGSTKVEGVDCYEILVTLGENNEVTWWIAKSDFLPRRTLRSVQRPNGERGGRELTVSNLVVNSPNERYSFALVVPEGFTKTDEFAP